MGTLIFGKPSLRDRGEHEVRGYREIPIILITVNVSNGVDEDTILELAGDQHCQTAFLKKVFDQPEVRQSAAGLMSPNRVP